MPPDRSGIENLAGQMLVFGWDADLSGDASGINDHVKTLIEEFRVGGLILMGRNVASKTQAEVAKLTLGLQALAKSSGLPPLLISTDQEGGRVARFGPPHFNRYPASWSIGETNDTQLAYDNARQIGSEMRSVGINWVLAPVLDVNNNPANPVIGDRSFGAEPELVSVMGAAAVRGFQEGAGVLACGKHFPGHGDTDVDSHLALPAVAHGRDRLDEIELAPFRAAIDAGIGSIMTTHILFPQIDPNLPATLSPTILHGILREEMRFSGVVVTDCLEMKAVANRWGSAQASVLAAVAGADMLLACHTLETQRAIRDAILGAASSGALTEERLLESNRRIKLAKERWAK